MVDEFEIGNGKSLNFRYDPNGRQYLKINKTLKNFTSASNKNLLQILVDKSYNQLTLSISKEYEEVHNTVENTLYQNLFVYAYGKLVAIDFTVTPNYNGANVNLSSNAVNNIKYVHQDIFDSIDTITNQSGSIIS